MKELFLYCSRLVYAVVFFAWTMTFLWLINNNNYQAFIEPRLFPYLVCAAVIFSVFATCFMMEHNALLHHTPLSSILMHWMNGFLLCTPILFFSAIIGESFGTNVLNNQPTDNNLAYSTVAEQMYNAMTSDTVTPIPSPDAGFAQQPQTLTVLEALMQAEQLDKLYICVEGQVAHHDDMPAHSFALFRFVMVCCAAHTSPVAIVVYSNDADTYSDEQWVRVTGQFRIEELDGQRIATIKSKKVTVIDTPPPQERYLFP